jgi:hypothetical protein
MKKLLVAFGEHKEEWKLGDTKEIIIEKGIYHWKLLDMNYFTISLDELSLLFRKFMETKY